MKADALVEEWRRGGCYYTVLNSKFLQLTWREQARLDGLDEEFEHCSNLLFRSREVSCPSDIPIGLIPYWGWRMVLRDVYNSALKGKPITSDTLHRIYYGVGGRYDNSDYGNIVQSKAVRDICDTLGRTIEAQPYHAVATFLCALYKETKCMPGAIEPAARWYANCYLCKYKFPPFVLCFDESATYFTILDSTLSDRSIQSASDEMEQFIIREVEAMWPLLLEIAK